MKTFGITLLLLFALVVGGCAMPPPAVKNALYTAQLSLEVTIKEVADGTREPWIIPAGATLEERLTIRERQIVTLTQTMEQADKNLATVIDWFRFGKKPKK